MQKMMCTVCGHVYDPGTGDAEIPPGVPFEVLPSDWTCPICGAAKSRFIPRS